MRLAIRADGGPNIGFGHLSRSGALAEEFLARGHTVTVATTTPQPALEVFPDGIRTVELQSRSDPEPFVDWLETATADVVLTDAYPVDTEYQRAIRERVPLAVLQDDARHAICSDLFVNGNLYAPDLDYEFAGQKPEMCLGTEYVLLRSEIRDLSDNDPPWQEKPERAIVTMGGSDIGGTTPRVVRAFHGTELQVDVIVGPGFENRNAIEQAVVETNGKFDVIEDPDDLPERMFRADIAVSATGSTIYELLALGTPTIGLPQADNQEPIANAFRERNAIVTLDGEGRDCLQSEIMALANDPEQRRTLRETGTSLIDGQGVERVYHEIMEVLA